LGEAVLEVCVERYRKTPPRACAVLRLSIRTPSSAVTVRAAPVGNLRVYRDAYSSPVSNVASSGWYDAVQVRRTQETD
jgi:hypothetical protein